MASTAAVFEPTLYARRRRNESSVRVTRGHDAAGAADDDDDDSHVSTTVHACFVRSVFCFRLRFTF